MTRLVVRCDVPFELARKRAALRLRDPRRVSDATPQIAEEQFWAFEELDELPAGSVLRLDTTQAVDLQVAEVARAVDRRLLPGGAYDGDEASSSLPAGASGPQAERRT